MSACKHRVSGSLSLPSRGPFHLSLTVLYAIGHQDIFSLRRWSSCFPTRFLVSCGTLDTWRIEIDFAYKTITLYCPVFQLCSAINFFLYSGPKPHRNKLLRFRLFPFRSPLLRKSIIFFLFLQIIRCFSSLGSLQCPILFRQRYCSITCSEFPHSEICGSKLIYSSPQLFAVSHVLRRCLVPRHPPYALISFNHIRLT